MEIRRLTINNYEELTELWSKARLPFKPRGRDRKESMAKQMNADPDFFIGAFEDDHLVGAAILTSDLRKGWINRLAAHPNYRRRGIAEALIKESERTLGKRGLGIFCALIEDSNVASRALFKKCGYVEHHDILYFSKRDSDMV
jgi:ribosomal protein S18 acetylase RimI-like enzyme